MQILVCRAWCTRRSPKETRLYWTLRSKSPHMNVSKGQRNKVNALKPWPLRRIPPVARKGSARDWRRPTRPLWIGCEGGRKTGRFIRHLIALTFCNPPYHFSFLKTLTRFAPRRRSNCVIAKSFLLRKRSEPGTFRSVKIIVCNCHLTSLPFSDSIAWNESEASGPTGAPWRDPGQGTWGLWHWASQEGGRWAWASQQ